jgi:hypothetical protein
MHVTSAAKNLVRACHLFFTIVTLTFQTGDFFLSVYSMHPVKLM